MSTLSTLTTAVDCSITVGSAFWASAVVSRSVLSFALRLTFTTTDCWYRTVTTSPTFEILESRDGRIEVDVCERCSPRRGT